MARKRSSKTWSIMWGFLGALAAGLFGFGLARYNMGMQQDFNDQNIFLAQQQNQMNRDYDWEKMQYLLEYNKPINQMKRYEEAGLNPNLIYGQTNVAPMTGIPSQTTPQGSAAPQFDGSSIVDLFQKMPFFKEQLESVKLGNEEKRLTNDILSERRTQEIYNSQIKSFEFSKVNAIMNDSEKFSTLVNSWFDKQILETDNLRYKNSLIDAQDRFQSASARLKELEYKFNSGEDIEQGYYEMRLEAMRIANALQLINLDWAEAEKAISAGSKFGSTVWSMVKSIMK